MNGFYLIVTIFVFWLCVFTHWIRKVKKHDRVLFPFCEIRRGLMTYLRANYSCLTKEDYERSVQLWEILDDTIHFYERHKATTFNFRPFVIFFRDKMKESEDTSPVVWDEMSPELRALWCKWVGAMMDALFAYTPWIRSEITLKIIVTIFKHFGTQGIKKLADILRESGELASRQPTGCQIA